MSEDTQKGLAGNTIRGDDVQWGAVALIDILGFKATIRDSTRLATVGRKLQSIRDHVIEMQSRIRRMPALPDFGMLRIVVQVVSDTFIVSVSFARDKMNSALMEDAKTIAVTQVCLISQVITTFALMDDEPHFAFRGCIDVGEIWLGSDVLLGDAVVGAARWHEEALVAAIFLTPRAAKIAANGATSTDVDLFPWDVPTHSLGRIKTMVLHPVWSIVTTGNFEHFEATLLKTFNSESEDVITKRKNTEAMLAAARALCNFGGPPCPVKPKASCAKARPA